MAWKEAPTDWKDYALMAGATLRVMWETIENMVGESLSYHSQLITSLSQLILPISRSESYHSLAADHISSPLSTCHFHSPITPPSRSPLTHHSFIALCFCPTFHLSLSLSLSLNYYSFTPTSPSSSFPFSCFLVSSCSFAWDFQHTSFHLSHQDKTTSMSTI